MIRILNKRIEYRVNQGTARILRIILNIIAIIEDNYNNLVKKDKKENKDNSKPKHERRYIDISSLKNKEVIKKEQYLSNILNYFQNSNKIEVSQVDWIDQSSPLVPCQKFQLFQRKKENSIYSDRVVSQFSK
ncbi:unnamed protein product [Paramecium sonneborni]|uniref:Uncharacterized protein n=1 Tax=Paramecium sonneborni TaxID=65129 RepID=A0A8S1M6J1_9CILI|nr:unnamed protein product [Paramecium sonneborni]